MDDLISRQTAIDALEEYADRLQMVDWKENPGVPYKAYALNWCINTIRDLPSAQPEPLMVTIDHELTKDEVERLKQSMSNTPIVLFPSVQPEPMSDLISRQAAIDAIDRAVTKEAARWSLQELPSAERRGRWKFNIDDEGWSWDYPYMCDQCGKWAKKEFNFCPNCGARMDKTALLKMEGKDHEEHDEE